MGLVKWLWHQRCFLFHSVFILPAAFHFSNIQNLAGVVRISPMLLLLTGNDPESVDNF